MNLLGDTIKIEIEANKDGDHWVLNGIVYTIGVGEKLIPVGKKKLVGENVGELILEFSDYAEELIKYFKTMYRKEKIENEG